MVKFYSFHTSFNVIGFIFSKPLLFYLHLYKRQDELINQLKIGGKMVIPVGDGDNQIMHLVEKISETETSITTHGNFSFVPMLDNKEN